MITDMGFVQFQVPQATAEAMTDCIERLPRAKLAMSAPTL